MGWLSWLVRLIPQLLATCENCGVWVRVQVAGIVFISKTYSLQYSQPQKFTDPVFDILSKQFGSGLNWCMTGIQ